MLFMSLFWKEIYFLNNGNLDTGGFGCARRLMFVHEAPLRRERGLIDNLRLATARLQNIWELEKRVFL